MELAKCKTLINHSDNGEQRRLNEGGLAHVLDKIRYFALLTRKYLNGDTWF